MEHTYWNKVDWTLLKKTEAEERIQKTVVHDDELYELKSLIVDLKYKKEAVDAHLVALQNTLDKIQEILDL